MHFYFSSRIWLKLKKDFYDLDLNGFQFSDSNIVGFSLVDYNNVNTIKLQADLFKTGEALNKLSTVPVNLKINLIFKNELSIIVLSNF